MLQLLVQKTFKRDGKGQTGRWTTRQRPYFEKRPMRLLMLVAVLLFVTTTRTNPYAPGLPLHLGHKMRVGVDGGQTEAPPRLFRLKCAAIKSSDDYDRRRRVSPPRTPPQGQRGRRRASPLSPQGRRRHVRRRGVKSEGEKEVKELLSRAVEIERQIKLQGSAGSSGSVNLRDCNFAIKTFADYDSGMGLLRSLRVFKLMRRNGSGCKPNLVTYSTLMSRALKVGKTAVAFRLWNLMLDEDPPLSVDTKAVNILLNAYSKDGDHQGAREVFEEMSLGGTGKMLPRGCVSCTPNVVSYNTLIDASHRCGDLAAGMQALQLMKENNLRPDTRTYTTLISTVGLSSTDEYGGNDPDTAFELFRSMEVRRDWWTGRRTTSAERREKPVTKG